MAMSKNTPYCLMPWIHLHVGDKGIVKACCVGNIPFGDVNKQSLDEIWNGEAINKTRNQFLEGIPDKRCFVCISREKSGAKSIRQETFEKFPDVSIEEIEAPIYFDIRFSNVCNFKCKTCWHGASSKWFEEAKRLGTTAAPQAIIKNIADFDLFIATYGEAILGAKEIYLAGGEPLVTEEHYLLLEFLIAHNKRDVHLRYNTNFSKFSFKHWDVLELWDHFDRVELMASVDDLGENGEVIREGFNWKQFLINREKIRPYKHIQFKVSPTISTLNVKKIPRFYQTLVEQNIIEPEDFYINILERPYIFNINKLPVEEKELINHTYSDFIKKLGDVNIKESFRDILNFMNI